MSLGGNKFVKGEEGLGKLSCKGRCQEMQKQEWGESEIKRSDIVGR